MKAKKVGSDIMDKISILKQVEQLIREGNLTKSELLDVYKTSTTSDNEDQLNKQSRISDILYYIGGGIVFLGICIFVGTNWNLLNGFTKVLATLGSAVMMYLAGTLLSRYEHMKKICDAFYFIANLIAPLGIFVFADVARMDTKTAGFHSIVAGLVLGANLLYYYMDRRNIFFIFNVIFGTWLFFGLTTFLIGGRPFANWDFIKYRWLAAGLTHMILGFALKDSDKKGLTPYLYSFGVVQFLTAALCLGGWSRHHLNFWEILFPGFTFGVIFLSVYLKTKSFLIFGTIYLMIYILKITNEYFTTAFGWALSLVIVGFALIGIGYFAFYINKKYISS